MGEMSWIYILFISFLLPLSPWNKDEWKGHFYKARQLVPLSPRLLLSPRSAWSSHHHSHAAITSAFIPLTPKSLILIYLIWVLLWCLHGKEFFCHCRGLGFHPWVRKMPWRRKWQPTPVFLPGNPMDRGVGGLQSMGSQRVGHDIVTKEQQSVPIEHRGRALRRISHHQKQNTSAHHLQFLAQSWFKSQNMFAN